MKKTPLFALVLMGAALYLAGKPAVEVNPYPNTIKNNKFYQLIDNGETEPWELHIMAIK
ncbi:MAG: hypothetical protein KAW12_29040 [Candidatus Aminicenantes bacterium]|nr:hypothetical protein [Candidatus Aminicenantes bacterium]